MFHFYILSFYILPGIYTYLRLTRLLESRREKLLFGIFYLLILAGFPLAEWISHMRSVPDLTEYLKVLYYSAPFILYLFLSSLIIDVFRILNRIFGFVSKGGLETSRSRRVFFIGAFLLSAIVVASGAVNHEILTVKKYAIEVPRRESKLEKLKLLFASDFHIKGDSDIPVLRRFVKKAKELDPGIVILGGDIFEGDKSELEMRSSKSELAKIRPKYGIFVAFGNHEYHGSSITKRFFKDIGVTYLIDSTIRIDNAFYIGGRADARFQERKPLKELLGKVRRDLPLIIVDHKPIEYEDSVRNGVDIQLSGHTHRGQLFPLNFIVGAMYELSYGYRKIENTHFFVTSGLKTWGPAVRTVGRSEIVLINVEFK